MTGKGSEISKKGSVKGAVRRRASHRTNDSAGACLPIAPSGAVTRGLKTSEIVARDIARDILEQGLVPGDPLASEADMQAQYGVSRESLREGLRLLEVQGLISIRRGPGGGPTVGTVDPANLGRISTLYYYLAGATYRELFEAWVVSECLLAELAASNPDAKARHEAMEPYLAQGSAPHADDELEAFIGAHLQFHAAIARLTNNRVLQLVLRSSGQIVSHHVAVTDDPRSLAEALEREHLGLAKAIAAGQPKKARRLMEEHIRNVAVFSEGHLGPGIDDLVEWR